MLVVFGALALGGWYAWRQDQAPKAEPLPPLTEIHAAPPPRIVQAPPRVVYVPTKPKERVRVVETPAKQPEVLRCVGEDGVSVYTTEPKCPDGATLDRVVEVHVPIR